MKTKNGRAARRRRGESPRSDRQLIAHIRAAQEELEMRAKNGSKEAARELERSQFAASLDHRDRAWKRAKEGHKADFDAGEWPAIGELLDMADFAIPKLQWLTQHRPDNVKPYARDRDFWPAYVGLSKSTEEQFQQLRGGYDQFGNRTAPGPIELGLALPFKVNRKTQRDILFVIATTMVRRVCTILDSFIMFDFAPFIKRLDAMKRPAVDEAVRIYREELGPFTRANWSNWRPVFDSCLTLHYGPTELRWQIIPRQWRMNLSLARHFGCVNEWLASYTRSKKMSAVEAAELLAELKTMGDVPYTSGSRPISERESPDWTVTGSCSLVEFDQGHVWASFRGEFVGEEFLDPVGWR